MKVFKILIILSLFFTPFISNGYYSQIDKNVAVVYDNFYKKVLKLYKQDEGLTYLYKLDEAINVISNSNKLNSSNQKIIFDLQKLNNEKIFNLEFKNLETENKQKLHSNDLLINHETFAYNNDLLFLENGIWYSYIFEKKYYFENLDKINKETLIYNGLYGKNILVYYDEGILTFVKEYEKTKLITDDIVFGIPNKYETLKKFKKNKVNLVGDDDIKLKQIKIVSKNITSGLYKKEDKIKAIYNYILDNISYTSDFTLEDYEIFSGIETFVNKNGVCEGYVELFQLMLSFNDIKSQALTGDVINAEDFPLIGHAWVKIGDHYYDPTFDDPVGALKTKTFEEYKYYKLPRDLFYTNRYDYGLTPDSLKTTPLEFRENLIKQNLSNLVEKYKNSNYNLIKPFIFKKENNLNLLSNIKLSDLINIYTFYNFEGSEIDFINKKRDILSMSYTILSNEVIETILEKNNYNMNDSLFLRWKQDNGNIEYIIVNEVNYQN